MNLQRNDPCWCGSGKKWKKCHYPAENPTTSFDVLRRRYKSQYGILLKTPEEIVKIRKACRFAASVLKRLCQEAKAGVTTNHLNDIAMELHRKAGATPPCLGYGDPPFPKAICTSLNDVVCHGIPNNTPLKEGDFLNIDVASVLDGYYGDCSAMVAIGKIDSVKQNVMDASYEALMKAISILKPGVLVQEIGRVIEDHVSKRGCSVVYQFVAHGVGIDFHEAPQIPHGYNDLEIPLAAGMTFTIEPMINSGLPDCVIDPVDKWTARTIDHKPSAQWEHTLLITPSGAEILTLSDEDL